MRALLLPLLALPLLAACRSARPGDTDDAWEYVRAKYDRNGDRRVVPAEYDRDEESFRRLDRDGDGRLTRADFERAGPMTIFVTERMLYQLFQDDDDPRDLDLDEIRAQFPKHDTDGDGTLSAAEFDAATQRTPPPDGLAMPPGMTPFRLVLRAIDRDRDGALGQREVETFFAARDEDGDGIWVMEGPPPRARERRERSGAQPGAPAPDFALRPPGGGAEMRLSSFRGDRPVALIFGSYT